MPLRYDGKSKGIAFIDFADEVCFSAFVCVSIFSAHIRAVQAGAHAAVDMDNTTLMDRYIKVSLSAGKPQPREGDDGGAGGDKRDHASHERPPGCKTVFVGNLPWGATEDDLRAIFESCGTIWNVRLAIDRETGQAKGYTLLCGLI